VNESISCPQHPEAPRIGGMCGGCTQYPTDMTETPEDTARRFARRLAAVEALCSGRPGYHTITVKALLTAMGRDDELDAGADTTADFFQPGRTYAYEASGFTFPELITVFRVACTTTYPATGEPFAFGWIRKGETTAWRPYAEPADDWPHAWTEISEESAR
jgi:hypothetical protein